MKRPSILLTRPEGENVGLQALLADAGFDVKVRPLIKITALDISPEMRNQAANVNEQDILVFVSRPAVRFGMALIDEYWPTLPAHLQVLAVGPGTASILAEFDVKARCPAVPGSEGLLDLDALQDVQGKKVMLASGRGGREVLADTLDARGAEVVRLETYHRERQMVPDLHDCLGGSQAAVVLTSGEVLQSLVAQACDQACDRAGDRAEKVLGEVTAVVASERIAGLAREAGFRQVINAGGASDQALYDVLLTALSGNETALSGNETALSEKET